jgi:uncharacterized membrane protein YgdD (TMEM256/DUF423 family)
MMRALILLAGLCGATGVALSAVAAHRAEAGNLATAANFLLFHAPAFLAIAAFCRMEALPRRLLGLGALLLGAGLTLFCGDLVMRVFAERSLFPMAAPSGGTTMILGWVTLAISGFFVRRA